MSTPNTSLMLTPEQWSDKNKKDGNTNNQEPFTSTCPLSIIFRSTLPMLMQEAMQPMTEDFGRIIQQSRNDLLNPSSSLQQLALHGLPGSAHSSFTATSEHVFREKQPDGNFKVTTEQVQIRNNDRTTKKTEAIVASNGNVLTSSEHTTNDKVNPSITGENTYPAIENPKQLQLTAGSIKRRRF